MPTEADTIADALLRREVFLQRFASHLANTEIDGTIQSFARSLPSLLNEFGDAENLTIAERRAVARSVVAKMREDWGGMWVSISGDLGEMSVMDADHVSSIYDDILDVDLKVPKDSTLIGHINQSTMVLTSGKTSQAGKWAQFLRQNTDTATKAINGAIWDGYTSSLNNQQILKQIRGTFNRTTKMYEGGILQGRIKAQADALVRTGTTHFSNQARDRTYQANRDILGKRILVATLDSRTTLLCRGRDLKEWDIDDRTYPRLPFHFNCLLPDSIITSSLPISSISKRTFKGEVINIITESGNSLTVTPNHPILSDRGWVFAKHLAVGDNAFSQGISEPVKALDVCNNYIDTSIKDIFESLRVSSSMRTSEVPLTTPDFHGDSHNGEVAIILSNIELSNVFNTDIIQEFSKIILISGCSNVAAFILRFSHFLKDYITNNFAGVKLSSLFTNDLSRFIAEHSSVDFVLFSKSSDLDSIVSHELGKHLSVESEIFTDICNAISFIIKLSNFIKVRIVHHSGSESALFTPASYIDSVFREDFLNNGFTASGKLMDSADTRSTVIKTDNIVKIKSFHYDGLVYNLETVGGIYTANNIVNHNCRSVYIVSVKGSNPLKGRIPSNGGKIVDGKLVVKKGTISAETTMNDWLRGQPKEFVVDSIGPKRAELFLTGQLSIDKFTDLTGRTLTLDELKATSAGRKAFKKSGLSG